jgi:uncharacterized protein YndB with AHSA1/START domain
MHFEFALGLKHPVDAVFDYLSDPDNRPQWQSSLQAIERVDEGPPRLGTRWREAPPLLGTFDMEIVEFETNRRWAEQLSGRSAVGRVTLEFSSEGSDGTTLRVRGEIQLRGPYRLGEPLVARLLPRLMRRDLLSVDQLLAGARDAGASRRPR